MAHVVFLRGVNVGGNRIFRPSIFAKQLKDCDVVNIGAAGTFVIQNRISQRNLRAELLRRLPFDAEIMICSGREIIDIVSSDPFDGQPSTSDVVRFVSTLTKRPQTLTTLPMELPAGKWLVKIIGVRGRFAFGLYRRQMGTLKYLGQLEKHLGTSTVRNWNTMSAIAKVLQRSVK